VSVRGVAVCVHVEGILCVALGLSLCVGRGYTLCCARTVRDVRVYSVALGL